MELFLPTRRRRLPNSSAQNNSPNDWSSKIRFNKRIRKLREVIFDNTKCHPSGFTWGISLLVILIDY